MIDAALGILVWVFVLYSVMRAYRREQRLDRYVILTWTIFVSVAVVFTLRVPAVRPVIDGLADDRPVTFLLSLLGVLTATAAYSLSLKWLADDAPEAHRQRCYHAQLVQAALVVAALLVALMVLHMTGGLTRFLVEHMMKWTLEAYALLQAGLVLVPFNVAMVRRERVFPMRVKHFATLVLCAIFGVSAALSVVAIPPMLFTGQANRVPYLIPRGPVAAVCLVIILVPHHWLTLLLLPRRLRRYVQLTRLERALGKRITIRRAGLGHWQLWSPAYVEMAIYVTLINVLDNYRRLDASDPRGGALVRQIDDLLPRCAEYDDLVEGVCRVTL